MLYMGSQELCVVYELHIKCLHALTEGVNVSSDTVLWKADEHGDSQTLDSQEIY